MNLSLHKTLKIYTHSCDKSRKVNFLLKNNGGVHKHIASDKKKKYSMQLILIASHKFIFL